MKKGPFHSSREPITVTGCVEFGDTVSGQSRVEIARAIKGDPQRVGIAAAGAAEEGGLAAGVEPRDVHAPVVRRVLEPVGQGPRR